MQDTACSLTDEISSNVNEQGKALTGLGLLAFPQPRHKAAEESRGIHKNMFFAGPWLGLLLRLTRLLISDFLACSCEKF
jgi:hypothetical protein